MVATHLAWLRPAIHVEGFSGGGGEGHDALDCLLQGIHC